MEQRAFITCRELIEFLHLYLEGELPADRVVEFERHLAVCASCVAYIQTYREASKLGRSVLGAGPDEPPEAAGVPEELVRAILAATGRR